MLNLETLTQEVVLIAKEIGGFLREERVGFQHSEVEKKSESNYVSYVDKTAEKKLVKLLSDLLPDAGFIAEEGTATYNDESLCWVIDPLDGTTNYIHNEAPYGVSIALKQEGEVVLGVVYEVCRDECFVAWKAGGAYLNDYPIRVSELTVLQDAFLILELPYNAEKYKKTGLYLIDELYGNVGGIRMNGSAAVGICYVALGRIDGWLEAFIEEWDFSAAALIVKEAGGTVTDFYGNSLYQEGHHLVVTNGNLHHALLSLIQECLPEGM